MKAIIHCLTGLMLEGLLLVGLLVCQFVEFLDEWTVIHAKISPSMTELTV